MKEKYALLTGFTGFIGKNLNKELSDQGFKVALISEMYITDEDWRHKLVEILDTAIPDCVFHVGACADTMCNDVNHMMTRNYETTVVISDWCRDNDVPMIFSSSAAIEGTCGLPTNLYAWSKKAAEDYVLKNGQIALRYYNVYGPGEENKEKMASVAYQAYDAKASGKSFPLYPGVPKRDFVHVEDVVLANIHAYENYSSLEKKAYHVGTGESHTFEEVLEALEIPVEHTHEAFIPEGYQFYTKADPEEMMPGWTARTTFAQGMNIYYEYLKIVFSKSNL